MLKLFLTVLLLGLTAANQRTRHQKSIALMHSDPNATIQTRTFFNPLSLPREDKDCGDDCDEPDMRHNKYDKHDKKHHETEMFTTPPPPPALWTTPTPTDEAEEAEAADVILFGIDSIHKAANDTALASQNIETDINTRVELIKKAVEMIMLATKP